MDASETQPTGERPHVVLVADDNEDIRNLLRARLSNRGFEVLVAADGQEALDMIRRHHPDIAILDWVMPVIQGHELCVKIKTEPSTADIPV
ncbi:MAG TPA: response regulator, partial [Solirubrobacterales bacterium]|nr:response regulator [Solirubrobacterales bacterium]